MRNSCSIKQTVKSIDLKTILILCISVTSLYFCITNYTN